MQFLVTSVRHQRRRKLDRVRLVSSESAGGLDYSAAATWWKSPDAARIPQSATKPRLPSPEEGYTERGKRCGNISCTPQTCSHTPAPTAATPETCTMIGTCISGRNGSVAMCGDAPGRWPGRGQGPAARRAPYLDGRAQPLVPGGQDQPRDVVGNSSARPGNHIVETAWCRLGIVDGAERGHPLTCVLLAGDPSGAGLRRSCG